MRNDRELTLVDSGLKQTHVLVLTTPTGEHKTLQALLEACHTLEVLAFKFNTGVGRLLDSIPSNSTSLIHLYNPRPGIYFDGSESFCSWSVAQFEDYIFDLEQNTMPEWRELGVSLRKIAQRFCDHHPGLKTRVRISPQLWDADSAQAIHKVDIPFFQTELEKEVGNYVAFELAPLLC
jgi:hypothetical protein